MPIASRSSSPALLVLAKAPLAGSVKTRLSPPLTPEQAAELAQAALLDTLDAVIATPAGRRILILDGEPGAWIPDGVEVLPQRSGGLANRLADAFADVPGASLLIGMDTPQVTPQLLSESIELLTAPGHDAVLGDTDDGGYWAIGLRRSDRRVFAGVPMSSNRTGAAQRRRLRELGLRVGTLRKLRDVDHYGDAVAVAEQSPHTSFARLVNTIAGHMLGSEAA